jgi:hypothetical protein
MQDPFDWLINKVAADLGVTSAQLKEDTKAFNTVMDYAKGTIFEYSDLIEKLHGKVGA